VSDKIEIIVWENGEATNITEWMYWFEEQGVYSIRDMSGHYGDFGITIIVNGEVVYEKKAS
jgi:hypothetical protein